MSEKSLQVRKRRLEKRQCVSCGSKLLDTKRQRCNKCLKKQVSAYKALRDRRRKLNLCLRCGKQATVRSKEKLCDICWFKEIAMHRTKSVKNWIFIKQLLEKQNYKCFYTHKNLIIGKNASLDHIIPIAKGGIHDITNLQWVDKDINEMKNDFTHSEFINTIKLILGASSLMPSILN